MVHVNKIQFPSELHKEVWEKFWKITKNSSSPETLTKNLSTLLTSNEIFVLEKRLAILLLLEKGMSYREISRTIDVTRSTISFVKHHFTKKSNHKNDHSRKIRRNTTYFPSVTKTMQKEIKRGLR